MTVSIQLIHSDALPFVHVHAATLMSTNQSGSCCLQLEVRTALAGVSNSDIMMLKSALGLSREQVVDSLRIARGDLELALKFELSALPLDRAVLDDLAMEYAAIRHAPQPPTLEHNALQVVLLPVVE